MTKICYEEKNFSPKSLVVIEQANQIIEAYVQAGYILTLRQLYYQFVSKALIPNTEQSYKRIGSIISDGRRAGLIHWEAIEDRTRNLEALAHWDSPAERIEKAFQTFRMDRWETQPVRPEVWIEKEALVGVIEDTCDRYDVPYFACRGYVSDSEMWRAGQRITRHYHKGQETIIFHLGDHDPSGIDMTRDIRDRLSLFSRGRSCTVKRIALNMDQIDQYNPPPNPAKLTDSRGTGYVEKYGDQSWELDALPPDVINELIEGEIKGIIEPESWEDRDIEERDHRRHLEQLYVYWDEVEQYIKDTYDSEEE